MVEGARLENESRDAHEVTLKHLLAHSNQGFGIRSAARCEAVNLDISRGFGATLHSSYTVLRFSCARTRRRSSVRSNPVGRSTRRASRESKSHRAPCPLPACRSSRAVDCHRMASAREGQRLDSDPQSTKDNPSELAGLDVLLRR